MDSITILGLGLIGGSIAAGLRANGPVRIHAVDANPDSIRHAVDTNLVDSGSTSIDDDALASDLIVVAVPVLAIPTVLPLLNEGSATITDVGSVKASVLAAAESALTDPSRFVPGHPIAGSERHGVSAANGELFRDRKVILTPGEHTDGERQSVVAAMWSSLGAEVLKMSAPHHDSVLAQTSHLPHLLAYALVDLLSQQGDSLEIFQYAAGGFRDFSRIAASDPVMWRDIFEANRDETLAILDKYVAELAEIRALMEAGDMVGMQALLARAKRARDHFTEISTKKKEDT